MRSFLKIALLAVLLRVLWAVLVPVSPLSDSCAYDKLAKNIVLGNGYVLALGKPTAYWPPGTSFVYAVLYLLFGVSYVPIVVFNIVLGLGIVVLSMLLASGWFGEREAKLAGLFLACWPALIQFTTILASELIFTFLTLSAVYVHLLKTNARTKQACFEGILLAAASYIRPIALLFPATFFFFSRKGDAATAKMRIRRALISCAVMFFLILPWSIRNFKVFGCFVPISTNGGANFWMGNNPESKRGEYQPPPFFSGKNEAENDLLLGKAAKEFIKREPIRFLVRSGHKLLVLHERETQGIGWNKTSLEARFGKKTTTLLKIIGQTYWVFLLVCGIGGVAVFFLEKGLKETCFQPAVLLWGYFSLVYSLSVVLDRYHIPSDPLIAILAAFFLSRCATFFRNTSVLERERDCKDSEQSPQKSFP